MSVLTIRRFAAFLAFPAVEVDHLSLADRSAKDTVLVEPAQVPALRQ